jgi:murein DD-endopeptidase MepM/ murein hydrolase activator NlpD
MNPRQIFRIYLTLLVAFLLLCLGYKTQNASASPIGTDSLLGWSSPVPGPVIRLFDRPQSQFSAGHRGIDYPAVKNEPILAPSDGIVSFVGVVFDRTVVVLKHGNGIESEVEPICPAVVPGEPILQGEPLGVFCIPKTSYALHCSGIPCLHFSIRKNGEYFAPQVLIGGLSPTRLLTW